MQSVITHPSHNFDGGVNMLLTWINLSLSCNVTARGTFYWYISDVIKGVMASQITSVTCLLNRLFMRISKKTSKLRVTGVCEGNSPMTEDFPAQMASNAENVTIWWRHHVILTNHFGIRILMKNYIQGKFLIKHPYLNNAKSSLVAPDIADLNRTESGQTRLWSKKMLHCSWEVRWAMSYSSEATTTTTLVS